MAQVPAAEAMSEAYRVEVESAPAVTSRRSMLARGDPLADAADARAVRSG